MKKKVPRALMQTLARRGLDVQPRQEKERLAKEDEIFENTIKPQSHRENYNREAKRLTKTKRPCLPNPLVPKVQEKPCSYKTFGI